MKSAFNPKEQAKSIDAKLIYGLEKVSQIYRTLLWQTQKNTGLSPLQSQIILFMFFHDERLVSISNFAIEFSVTKATVSDAVKTLIKKELLEKKQDPIDKRRQSLNLTSKGINLVDAIKNYTEPLELNLGGFSTRKKEQFFGLIQEFLTELNKNDVISPLRMCTTCRYYELREKKPYCKLMEAALKESELRLDCAEHEVTEN